MKKLGFSATVKASIGLLFLCCTLSLPGQSTLEQAMRLRKYIKVSEPGAPTSGYFVEMEEDQLEYFELLTDILGIPSTVSGADLGQAIADSLFGNPFISADEEDAPKILMPQSYASVSVAISKERTPVPAHSFTRDQAGVTGTNFTTRLVDGFSRWLVQRTKQEMSLHFFSRFEDAINRQSDLRVLFPNTFALLSVLDEEIYNYQAYLASLKEGFISDFQLVPNNLSAWADQSQIIKNDKTRFLLKEGLNLPPMIMEGRSPYELIQYLGNVKQVPEEYQPVFNALDLLQLISNSVYHQEYGWVFKEAWEKEVDELTLYLYMGILFEKGQHINLGKTSFGSFLSDIAQQAEKEKIQLFKSLVTNLLDQGERTNKMFQSINKDTINYPQFYEYSRSTIGFFEIIRSFTSQLVDPASDKVFGQLLGVVKNGNNLVFHIRQQNYLQGLADFNAIIDLFINDEITGNETVLDVKKSFLKYATFMATVADAQSAEAVEFAFEIFALPPGSSKMKKYSPISVGLNTYVGPMVGAEYLEEAGGQTVFALHAPVGLNLNFGKYEKGSHSIFIPILDIGAVTAFRFGDNTSTLPELSFKNLIAPGLYYVRGFGKDKPFSFGVGGQLGPNTRKIELDANGQGVENRVDSGIRLGVFLSVDIPVFHFYTQ